MLKGMNAQPPPMQMVAVLYRCDVPGSATLRSLQAIAAAEPGILGRVDLLLYDNSPEPQVSHAELADPKLAHLGRSLEYVHDAANRGLAAAYQAALERAGERGSDWLLLLDQDTTLTPEFFRSLFETIQAGVSSHVCAVVPQQVRDGSVLSPRLVRQGRELPVLPGVATERLTVFNSAACMRTAALWAIGGFPQQFPLDYLDHVVFHRLQGAGGRVLVLPVALEHQLSVKNLEEEMSLPRYQRLLAAEWGYILEVRPKGGPLVQRIRLLQRALGQARLKNKEFARATLASALAALPR